MKYHIQKNTVQETLVIPLYARKKCSELFPDLYYDEISKTIISQIDYDFSPLEKQSKKIMQKFGFLEVAMRQYDIMCEIKEYLEKYPKASIVNLGCGLDSTGRNCDNGECFIYNLDLPDVIEVRNQILPAGEREENISCNLNDTKSWFEKINSKNGAIFFASGVFYYFTNEQVSNIVKKMADTFPDCKLVFDTANKKAVKLMLKTWVKKANITDVNAYFSVSNAKKELSNWSKNIIVSSRKFMLGYNDLKSKSVSGLFRFFSKIGDNMLKMQIVRIDFKKNINTNLSNNGDNINEI